MTKDKTVRITNEDHKKLKTLSKKQRRTAKVVIGMCLDLANDIQKVKK